MVGHAVVARGISPLRVGPGLGDSPLRVVQGVVSLQPSPQRVASLWWSSRPGELSRGVRTDHSPFRELPPVGRVAREPSVCSKKTERVVPFLERWAPSSLFGPKLTSGKNKIPVRTAVAPRNDKLMCEKGDWETASFTETSSLNTT